MKVFLLASRAWFQFVFRCSGRSEDWQETMHETGLTALILFFFFFWQNSQAVCLPRFFQTFFWRKKEWNWKVVIWLWFAFSCTAKMVAFFFGRVRQEEQRAVLHTCEVCEDWFYWILLPFEHEPHLGTAWDSISIFSENNEVTSSASDGGCDWPFSLSKEL